MFNLGFAHAFALPALFTAAMGLTDYDPKDYQLGSTWDKVTVTAKLYQNSDRVFRKAALATASVGGGTGFYLGKFDGAHVFATNHHVCSMGAVCLGNPIVFTLLNKTYSLNQWIGTFKDIDLTLMTFKIPPEDESLFASLASNFAFNRPLQRGLKLLTIGYGIAGNPTRYPRSLMAAAGSDCVVMSKSNEYRSLPDPDTVNPLPEPVWSFASACDVSHGDSGSAMIDRETGEIVGILWTGTTPKDPNVQSSALIQRLLRHPNETTWTQLSYAVPAAKMRDSIYQFVLHNPYASSEAKATLLQIIGFSATRKSKLPQLLFP
jgi:hypothetical protein